MRITRTEKLSSEKFTWKLSSKGFSLVELMVVIVIVAILAIQVVTISRNPIIDVKGAIFSLRSDISNARAEAARRNSPVLVDFQFDNPVTPAIYEAGYEICIDSDSNNSCAGEPDIIKTVDFKPVIRFYDNTAGGPTIHPNAGIGYWPEAAAVGNDDDGVTFPEDNPPSYGDEDFLVINTDGSCNANGTVFLYSTEAEGSPPLALRVSQAGVMRILRWRVEQSAWSTK